MKFDVSTIYFGVAVQMSDRINHTYVNAAEKKAKVWFEDGFFFIDDGGADVICIVPANVRQFTKKRSNDTARVESITGLRSVKLDK